MRSMYSAVSGLRIHQGKMDTIGNNIANVNTVGFKKGQVSFQEVFSQVTRGVSAPQGGKGGTNPQQIGMGASVGSVTTVHTNGPGQRTDNPTDLMIGGEGFFVVSDDAGFNNKFYTRAGNLTLDRDGNLVTADGFKVLGYAADEEGNIQSDITNIRINKSETKAPTATDKIYFEGNLNANPKDKDPNPLIDTTIQDSLGNSYKITFKLEKGERNNGNVSWDLSVARFTDLSTGNYTVDGEQLDQLINWNGNDGNRLIFNSDGELTSIDGEDIDNYNPISIVGLNGIQFTHKMGDDPVDGEGSLDRISPSGEFRSITLFDPGDPNSTRYITQYANETDLTPKAKTGNTSGSLEGFTIDATGTVTGVFTNGERKSLGQIMLAKFDNPMGLQKMGGNFFLDTRNSGEPQFGKANTSGFGGIEGGTLEMSNVDISLEFTEMITTQRGFQANSRIITTSDEMLQELVNMKR